MGHQKKSVAIDGIAIDGMDEDWVAVSVDEWYVEDKDDMVCVRRLYSVVVAELTKSTANGVVVPRTTMTKKAAIVVKKEEDEEPEEEWMPGKRDEKRGKALVKGGLVERYPSWCSEEDGDGIEVKCRPERDGLVATTAVDDLVPELLGSQRRNAATLNKRQRWSKVWDLLEALVAEGTATVVQVPEPLRRGNYTCAPQTVYRYAVKATSFLPRMESSTQKSTKDRQRQSRERTVYRYVKQQLIPWYEMTTDVPQVILAARDKHTESNEKPPFDALTGILRAPPKRRPLTKKERRAFAPSVSKSVPNVRAALNGVVDRAVELYFGRRVFVTYVAISGKIHDTVQVDAEDEDDDKPRRYRDGQVVGEQQKRKVWLGLDGTDAYCLRISIEARLSADWLPLGEYVGPASGRDEILHSLADSVHATLRDGVFGVYCTGLRFRGIEYHRSPALRVGAFGADLNPRRSTMSTSFTTKEDDDDDIVVYQLSTAKQDQDEERATLLKKFALKPRRTSGAYWDYPKCPRMAKRKLFAKEITDATDAYYCSDISDNDEYDDDDV